MARVTAWPARRAGSHRDIILCGRQVAGRYVCQGEIAYYAEDDEGGGMWYFPAGLIEDPPGSGFYREVTRFDPRDPHWRRPQHVDPEGQKVNAWIALVDERLPARRRCPHCKTLAQVSRDLLE